MDEYTLLHYLTADGRDVFNEWLRSLRDVVAKASVIKRLNRAAQGNLGDWKPCREGVYELRVDNGYRVYYTRVASNTLLILCGGAKSTQREDIKRAVIYRRDWHARQEDETT